MVIRRRRSNTTRSVRWSFLVPVDIAVTIENHFWDPTRQKPAYGKRNAYVVALLRQAIERDGLNLNLPQS
jgi:hypothetical protein